MDRHPQQIKRERQDKKRRARNVDNLSKLRTNIKKVLSSTSKKDAKLLYASAVSFILVLGVNPKYLATLIHSANKVTSHRIFDN